MRDKTIEFLERIIYSIKQAVFNVILTLWLAQMIALDILIEVSAGLVLLCPLFFIWFVDVHFVKLFLSALFVNRLLVFIKNNYK